MSDASEIVHAADRRYYTDAEFHATAYTALQVCLASYREHAPEGIPKYDEAMILTGIIVALHLADPS